MNIVSLFAGIGGFELAFETINAKTTLMCEIDNPAKHVLSIHFPNTPIINDVCDIETLPKDTDILCAGFPCQDLSSVGEKQGLSGTRSSLVKEVFRILKKNTVEWVIFENVSFMLSLRNGEAISTIISNLEKLGYNWAYRSIDSITFLPQHRTRVFIVASLHHNPCNVILSGESQEKYGIIDSINMPNALGFYWTEGRSALGLISNALPTLKAGSTIGIPSAPAILSSDGNIGTPDIKDAERLQGFPADWTACIEDIVRPSYRWKLVGNAVTVNTVSWIASKIINPQRYDMSNDKEMVLTNGYKWSKAAWGANGKRYTSNASLYPQNNKQLDLMSFLEYPTKPLSIKAAKGFESRLHAGTLKYPEYFANAIHQYILKNS